MSCYLLGYLFTYVLIYLKGMVSLCNFERFVTIYVDQIGLKLREIHMSLSLKFWDYKHMSPPVDNELKKEILLFNVFTLQNGEIILANTAVTPICITITEQSA